MPRCFLLALSALALAANSFGAIDQDLLALAPYGSTVLTGVDVLKASGTPFGSYLLREMEAENEHLDDFVKTVGFDPRRDVESVLVAGVAGKSGPAAQFAMVARGTFSSEKVLALARSNGAAGMSIAGVSVLVHGPKPHQFAICFPQPDILLMGDLPTVREVLAKREQGSAIDPKLLAEVNRVGSDHDVWFATILGGSYLGQELGGAAPPPLGGSQALRAVLSSSGGFQFGSTVVLSLDLKTRSPQDAQSVSDVLRFASNLVQMQGASNQAQNRTPDPRTAMFASMLMDIKVNVEGDLVRATLGVPEDKLEKFISGPQNTASLRR